MRAARSRSLYLARQVRAALPLSPRKVPEDAAAFEERLAWILGSPRTGSTWLLKLLVHPLTLARTPTGVSAPVGLSRRDRPDIVPINESHVSRHLVPVSRSPEEGEDGGRPEWKRGLRGHSSYLLADEYADVWREKARELLLARLRAQAEAGARQLALRDPIVVVKEPQSQGADVLMSLLPGSRLIFLMRDGREVVRSMLALYGPGGRLERARRGPGPESEELRLRFVERQSRRWVERTQSVHAAFRAHAADRRLIVRYEDLTRDPSAGLRRLTDWLGMGRTDEQIRAAVEDEATRRAPSQSGRRAATRDPSVWELSPAERKLADEVMGPMLKELGYPT